MSKTEVKKKKKLKYVLRPGRLCKWLKWARREKRGKITANLSVSTAAQRDSLSSDHTNCHCVGMPTVAWFSKMNHKSRFLCGKCLSAQNKACLHVYRLNLPAGPPAVVPGSRLLIFRFILWTMDLHTHTHSLICSICFIRVKETFSCSLWTLWIFSVF